MCIHPRLEVFVPHLRFVLIYISKINQPVHAGLLHIFNKTTQKILIKILPRKFVKKIYISTFRF